VPDPDQTRADVRVQGSPSRCPWCRDDLTELREVVACAGCGARHHDECHREHGRCASCGGTARLVFEGAPPAPVTRPPAPADQKLTHAAGVVFVALGAAVAALAIVGQLHDPQWGALIMLLGMSAVLGGVGVHLVRLRPPGAATAKEPAPAPERPFARARRREAGGVLVFVALLMALGAGVAQLDDPEPGTFLLLLAFCGMLAAAGAVLRREAR
jgi:hypothetical protein